MSTPAPPGTADALEATQQQLDELETLLQRMLTLPVQQLDEEAARDLSPPPEAQDELETTPSLEVGADIPASLPDAEPETADTVPSIELPERTVPRASFVSRFECIDTSALDPSEEATSKPEVVPAPKAEAKISSTVIKASKPIIQPIRKQQPVMSAPPIAGWLWLLLRINRLFDRCTRWFGTPGWHLRSERGRAVLGWLGLAMLAAAVGWGILDWIVKNW